MVRKIHIFTLILFSFIFSSKIFASPIDDLLEENPEFSSAVVGISIKDINTGEVLYQKNPTTRVHPASTLKFITSSAIYDYLGPDYQFKTAIYKSGDKIYFKVGADPIFTYTDMSNLISQYAKRNNGIINKFSIDDKIIDKEPFGIGWQWDDNADIHFPQMSPYILNHNIFIVRAKITSQNTVIIETAKEYSEPVNNYLKYGEQTDIRVTRNLFRQNQSVTLNGNVNSEEIIQIPAINPQLMYNNVLVYHFLKNDIPINTKFRYEETPQFCTIEAEITHSINEVLNQINQNSDNLAAEILLKHAGHIKTEKAGTTKDGLDIVNAYYKDKGLNPSSIHIVDASGISMNDYVSADFMTSALKIISKSPNFTTLKNSMTTPETGTFQNRLTELTGRLHVKTGTLANTSAVIGYIKTNSRKDVAFAIIFDNLPENVNIKALENELIKSISKL